MNTNISDIAKSYEDFIRNQMAQIGLDLHASNPEDEELVRRAAFLARHNYVKISAYSEERNVISFVVQDATPTNVTFHINAGNLSCDCPKEHWCRHKLAALFVLYQYIDSLATWLEGFRSKKATQLNLMKDERSPEAWLRLVQNVYKTNLYNQPVLNPYLVESIFADMERQIFQHTPLEREWQSLYKLFTHLALLSHTWKHLKPTTESYKTYFNNFIEHEAEKVKEHIRLTSSKSRLFATDPFYDTLQKMVNYFLLHQNGYFEQRLYIYTFFWESMFNEKSRRESELASIKNDRHIADDVKIASIESMFFIMLKKYDELEQELADINDPDMLIWIDLAHFADRNEDDKALSMIIRAMLPCLDSFINTWLSTRYRSAFVSAFNKLCSKIDLNDEEAEVLFSSSGMYGMQPYSLFLIERGRYMEWTALHHRFPSSLAYLELCGLKNVLEEKPDALLPLYHALAMSELNQKSRQHYKQAVRVWKKMKMAAKKSGKNEFWNNYVDQTRQQYKRLRALQEEIEKGNLKL
ncbi:hypothetical protein ACIQ4I_14100 [Rummeliibacillus sp. NPDC094406]|uniref:hypothetical protein n=1 Tax=Rummeliibacillus sp. NPDC094406 TaxID=3364511 RepID=UPI003809827E